MRAGFGILVSLTFMLSPLSVSSVARAEEGVLRNYAFTPDRDMVSKCRRAGYVGSFKFTHLSGRAWEVRFPATDANFVLFHDYGNVYRMSVSGGMTIVGLVDFDSGEFQYEHYSSSKRISCLGSFR